MTAKSQAVQQRVRMIHTHFTITCGGCEAQFGLCSSTDSLPCFVFCPVCQAKIIFWIDPDLPNGA